MRARLPFIAQIAGIAMLVALVADPRWWTVTSWSPAPQQLTGVANTLAPGTLAPGTQAHPAPQAPNAPLAPLARPAHLNLDVRHAFGKADLTVSVDGKRAFLTTLEGSGKRFGMFGKRGERSFTRTLDLQPGTRVVLVRLRSVEDKFDQSRVERFDLDSAAVASIKITADRSGLSLVAERPPVAVPMTSPAPGPAGGAAGAGSASAIAAAAPAPQAADVIFAELFSTLRSILIAVAGFIASAATGYVVQEFMRNRRSAIFAEAKAAQERAPRVRIAAE